jgi:hypothetical protein
VPTIILSEAAADKARINDYYQSCCHAVKDLLLRFPVSFH